jgi:hypothetical protein
MKDCVLWTIHPKYLDNFALKSCWNYAAYIKNIIISKKKHDDLKRFTKFFELDQIKSYMLHLYIEGVARGLEFEPFVIDKKILRFAEKVGDIPLIPSNKTQLKKERRIYLSDLKKRDSQRFLQLCKCANFEKHPSFKITK